MIIAIDTGGTKTLIAQFSETGAKQTIARFPTPVDHSEYIDAVSTAIREHIATRDIQCIALAIPGTIYNGVVSKCGNLPFENFDVATQLRQALDGVPVFIENDANLGGLGEVCEQKLMNTRALYVTISTGIGGGFIVDGKIDATLSHSEIGAMQLEHDGVIREWESFASGRAIMQHYHKLASDIEDPEDWEDISTNIAQGFLALLPCVRPDIVIVGGGVGSHYDKFATPLHNKLSEHLPEYYLPTFVQAKHPEEAVIYGCYHYALACINS